jgi:cytochrome c5
MKSAMRLQLLVPVATLAMSMLTGYAASQTASNTLASPESFVAIADTGVRSAAMFTELGKVLTHPRCVNCHPAGDRPHQGDQSRLHQPPVARGVDGHGTETMRCSICHQNANFDPGRMPGHPEWHLAPRDMAWEGKTIAEICTQIKDPARNGGRTLEDLVHHIGTDTLVGWAWHPGFGRAPAPGTQQEAGALVDGWIKTGAACPAG